MNIGVLLFVLLALVAVVATLLFVKRSGQRGLREKAEPRTAADIDAEAGAELSFAAVAKALHRKSSFTSFHEEFSVLNTERYTVPLRTASLNHTVERDQEMPSATGTHFYPVGTGATEAWIDHHGPRTHLNTGYLGESGPIDSPTYAECTDRYGPRTASNDTYADGGELFDEPNYASPVEFDRMAVNALYAAPVSGGPSLAPATIDPENEYAAIDALLCVISEELPGARLTGNGAYGAALVWTRDGETKPLFMDAPDAPAARVSFDIDAGGWLDEQTGDLYIDIEGIDDCMLTGVLEGAPRRTFSASFASSTDWAKQPLRVMSDPCDSAPTASSFWKIPASQRRRFREIQQPFVPQAFTPTTSGLVCATSVRRSNPLFVSRSLRSSSWGFADDNDLPMRLLKASDVANEPTYLDINPFPARGSWVSDAR